MNLDADTIVNLQQSQSENDFARRMFNPRLMALRAQLPGIKIMPMPNEVLAYKLTANTPQDIRLPSGCKLVKFSGNGEYFITRKGSAQVPTSVHEWDGSGALMNPEDVYYYVEEINSLSAIAPYDCRLSVECFIQL